MSEASRQRVSTYRKTVAFMKLFLDSGLTLDENMENFKVALMMYRERAKAGVAEFLAHGGVASPRKGSVLKHMRDDH